MTQFDSIVDANLLVKAFRDCKKGVNWKTSVQRYDANLLMNTYSLQKSLMDKTYDMSKPFEFDKCERGKLRHIKALTIGDRVVQRALCDNVVIPTLRPKLIYDNGASLKGKGVDFTRRRLVAHLEKFYREHHSNKGFILMMDYSKYFDNILHRVFLEDIEDYFDEDTMWLIKKIMKGFEIDVSYLIDEEFETSEQDLFNSIEHEAIDKHLLTGQKMLSKSMGIGSQLSQIAGVYYPHKVDNYAKTVLQLKLYARYADDSYVIHEDKDYLYECLAKLSTLANELGIHMNRKKCQVAALSNFSFMKMHYSLDNYTGLVNITMPNATFRRERVKLLKFKHKLDAGTMTLEDIHNSYLSWRGSVERYDNHFRLEKIDEYFKSIFNMEV